MQRTRLLTLSSVDQMHILDALKDALVELDDNELVSQRVIDKLTSALEIVDDGSDP